MMNTVLTVLLVLLVIAAVALAVLYFVGRRLQEKQAASQPALQAAQHAGPPEERPPRAT